MLPWLFPLPWLLLTQFSCEFSLIETKSTDRSLFLCYISSCYYLTTYSRVALSSTCSRLFCSPALISSRSFFWSRPSLTACCRVMMRARMDFAYRCSSTLLKSYKGTLSLLLSLLLSEMRLRALALISLHYKSALLASTSLFICKLKSKLEFFLIELMLRADEFILHKLFDRLNDRADSYPIVTIGGLLYSSYLLRAEASF